MLGNSVHAVELVFLLLLLFVVAFAALARKIQVPYPIVLVIAGLILGFIPGIPHISLSPDVIFLVVLPPLLYAGAWFTSWRDFSYNIVSILFLAFGLVGFTVWGVAEAANYSFAPFDLRLGVVLGAVVATTDAIAATSIAKNLGLPQRIVDILEGESLVNDATGLLALEFGVAMVVRGETPTVLNGAIRLIWLVGGGIIVGLLIALLIERVERYLDDGPIEITLSIMIPYAAYLAAEYAHSSGVLAVVACGLYLGRRETAAFLPQRSHSGPRLLGLFHVRDQRTRLRPHRLATSLRPRRHPRLLDEDASSLWRHVQRARDSAPARVAFPRRIRCQHHPSKNFPSKRAAASH